jgi:hypothetical protein
MRNDSAATVAYLIERQRIEKISAAEMARRLGLSEANWCHTRKGRRPLQASAAARASLLYPELAVCEEAAS